ncbi:hypothetical protein FRC03_008170 [Tulasnella sp. 419]|nr:hypothetical protein FRC03_008170 [Tulasnella sp. 419]
MLRESMEITSRSTPRSVLRLLAELSICGQSVEGYGDDGRGLLLVIHVTGTSKFPHVNFDRSHHRQRHPLAADPLLCNYFHLHPPDTHLSLTRHCLLPIGPPFIFSALSA